ncbi:hypothetical protein JTB14_002873 [Gonioctena quinquepunctata]|nr:hypothetical protein JTB14_002873 [Gonioctena quinquepunctata]
MKRKTVELSIIKKKLRKLQSLVEKFTERKVTQYGNSLPWQIVAWKYYSPPFRLLQLYVKCLRYHTSTNLTFSKGFIYNYYESVPKLEIEPPDC